MRQLSGKEFEEVVALVSARNSETEFVYVWLLQRAEGELFCPNIRHEAVPSCGESCTPKEKKLADIRGAVVRPLLNRCIRRTWGAPSGILSFARKHTAMVASFWGRYSVAIERHQQVQQSGLAESIRDLGAILSLHAVRSSKHPLGGISMSGKQSTSPRPEVKRPGGDMATRPLHFIFLADCSGSMSLDGKIESLNNAIREVIPHMQRVAEENPHAEVLLRAIKFSDGAQWHISQPTPVDEFLWEDLDSEGGTDMGMAFQMVADQLRMPPMTDRALPPVLVLLSDGQPTDDANAGLRMLLAEPWGKKAVRIAITIGDDADTSILQKFVDHPELKPLKANNPEQLVKYIKWASTAVLKAASSPASMAAQVSSDKRVNVPVPLPPDDDEDGNSNVVW